MVLQLWFALAVGTNSCAWLSTAILVTNMRNFPVSRGTVAGILKVIRDSVLQFLLKFTAWFFTILHPSSFYLAIGASVAMGLYILATTILDNFIHISDSVSYALLAVMILLLLAPLVIPTKMTLCPRKASNTETPEEHVGSSDFLVQDGKDNIEPLLSSSSASGLGSFNDVVDGSAEVAMLLAEGEGAVRKKRRPKRGEDFKFTEALVKADYWLLFFVYFVGVGTGVTVLNNLAQIGIAQGMEDTTNLLSLFSFFNLWVGLVEELFQNILSGNSLCSDKYDSKDNWMTCTQIIMIFSYLVFAYAIKGTLYPAIAILGICYGVQFSIVIPTVSELLV
ncbi:hypothetical protein JHK82_036483 [Glycine max]|nr:hypothetical protein JHK82_036483 [Glycine max]